MPVDTPKPLTEDQSRELLADLRLLRDRLAAALAEPSDSDQPVDLDEPIGRLSRIDAIQQQEIRKSGRRGQERRVALIQAAIARGESEDDYGACAECEEPVGYRRLKARPESRYCLRCQSAREAG